MNLTDFSILAQGTAAVSPLDYGNLSAWWDAPFLGYADDTPIDNASNKWTDRSGNNNHLIQATAAKRPLLKTGIINGKDIVRFDSNVDPNNDVLNLTSAITFPGPTVPLPNQGKWTIIVVGLVTRDSVLFGYSGGNQQFRRYPSNLELMSIGNVGGSNSTLLSTAHNVVHMMTFRRTGATLSFRENKTSRGTGSNGLDFIVDRMGITSPVFSELAGDIGEAVIYSDNRSDAEVDNLYDNYFKTKWGLP